MLMLKRGSSYGMLWDALFQRVIKSQIKIDLGKARNFQVSGYYGISI